MTLTSKTAVPAAAALKLLAGLLVLTPTSAALAQNVINSNTTIRSALCVGFNCLDTEAYGFDIIRLKSANTRLLFDDASSTNFPNNDWRLVANDSSSIANGGQSYFAIEDATAGTTLLRLSAGAPDNALTLDATGQLGIGTALPSQEIHIATDNTPTFRLEQDGSGSFAAQSWDIGGNEESFFLRDQTNNGIKPFRIKPGAPADSLVVESDGAVAIGGDLSVVSSRDAKKRIEVVNGEEVLSRLVALPIQRWRYKTEDDNVEHLGPMAEDFHAAFGLGQGEKSISVVDSAGVALAAIQALALRVESLEAENGRLREELEQRLRQLKVSRSAPFPSF